MFDPYIYPETSVLKNKLNIKDNNELKMAEADFSSVRLKELYVNALKGCCDFKYLCQVHDYIFQDLFEWSGQPRVIDIAKSESVLSGESIEYAHYEGIEEVISIALKEMNQIAWLELSLEEKAEQLSKGMEKIWKAHPFREGNTRTTIIFIAAFAQQKGFSIDVKLLAQNSEYVRKALVAASSNFTFNGLEDKSNPEYLIRIVRGAIERGNKQ